MVTHGAKTQAAHLGQPIFLRVAQKKEKNDPRQNVTKEYDSQENMIATYDRAPTRHVPCRSLWRHTSFPYVVYGSYGEYYNDI